VVLDGNERHAADMPAGAWPVSDQDDRGVSAEAKASATDEDSVGTVADLRTQGVE
jgi:hypothetical protein